MLAFKPGHNLKVIKTTKNDNKYASRLKTIRRFLPLTESAKLGLETEPKISDFNIIKQIDKGTFGKVYLVEHKETKVNFALKIIDKLKNCSEMIYFRREIEVMYRLNHPNIVKLYGHFEDNVNVYLLLDYVRGENLYNYMKTHKINNELLARIVRQLVAALYYLHNMKPTVVHRDINFLNPKT